MRVAAFSCRVLSERGADSRYWLFGGRGNSMYGVGICCGNCCSDRGRGFPQAVIHRGGRPAPVLAQWWSCGGGGRTSPIWCCRPSAEAAEGLARRSVLSAVPPWTGPHRAGCDRRRSRPDYRSCMRRLGMRMRCGRCCWRTRSAGLWGSRGRSVRRWRGLCGRGCGRFVRRALMGRLGGGCCWFPCRPRGGPCGPGGMTRLGGSPSRRRESCGGRGCRRAWWPYCGSGGAWSTSRGSTPGSGWTTSPVR